MSDLVNRLRENALLDECEGATDYVVALEREAADRIEELEREVERWRQGSIDTWGAMNAMRNAINEHVAMPSIEGDLLKGPDNSVFCATVADAVIGEVLSLHSKLSAEKALADEICAASQELAKIARFFTGDKGGKTLAEAIDKMNEIVSAYRKARGM